MQRVLQFLFLALSIAILFGVSTREAKADDPNATTIRTRLEEFFELTDTLSQFEELDEEIPFTDFSPSSTEGLQLADLLADADALAANSLEDKVASLSVASLASLQSGIDGADATYGDVDVTFDSVTVALNGGNPDLIDVGFTLTLTRNGVTLPVSYTDGGSVNLHGGSISVDLSASAVLSFQLDTSATDPDLAFYTVGAPQFDFSAAATGSITGFTANFGLTEVSVSGTATLNIDINLDFVDPDADGKITVDEWTSTSIPDLVDAGFGNGAGDDVNIALSLDTTLLTGSPDATVTLVDDDLSNGLNSPSVTLGLLDKFDNLSPTQLLGGIAQLVGALGSAQGNAAGKLPFIQGTLDAIGEGAQKVFEIAEPLIKFLDGQGAAAITCGTMDNGANLPSGPFANLPPGSTLYCRAVTAENPTAGSITWTITGGTAGANTSAPGSNGTVAEIPTKSATFANVGGSPDVRVVFTDSKGSHTVDPINSVQEMVTLLQDAGLDLPPLNYDSSTQALTFDLTKSSTDPAAKTGQIDFGDQLREAANLAGLSADIDAGADATVDVSGVNLDLTFGAILVDDPADITPNTGDPDIGDRFFVKVDNTASAHEFKVDSASITADVFLKGRVGFLEVTAEGDDGANPSGDAFDVSKLVGADPVLSADIVASGVPVGGGSPFTIPDAVLISELLTALGPSPIACGTANADPPTGDATGAGSGATVYCQATTAKTVTSLNWSIVGGTVGGNGTNTSTAGPTPSVNASFSITGTGGLGAGYKLRLEYTDADGSHVAFLPRLLDAKCNLKMSGGIKVTASAGGSELGSGNVAISWPDVFGDDCLPDPGGISVTADTDFNANLKLFDPFPTVTGTNDHLKALPADQKQLLTDTTKNFNLVGNLLNATLTNKTTGASCVITIIAMTINPNDTLSCFPLSLSGGARQTWLVGDEYEVTGNPLALLSQIIDQLDAIVDALGGAGVPVDQELPLLGISTEDLVAKIQNLKVTLDELRGFPTGTITCGTQENGLNPPSGDITGVPDGTSIYCRAVTQKAPDSFAWKITKGGAIAGGDVASQPNTVDLTPTDNIEFVIDDGDGDPTTTISEYQIVLEHTDSAGTHTTDFPALAPPNSLQKLEEAIELKLGIDPAALQLLLLDIGPQKATGTHDGAGGDGTLTDGGAAFIADGVVVGNTVTNVTDGSSCRIVAPLMAGSAPCSLAGGEENDWDNGDKYTIYGDETVDLVIRLGYGFCTTGNVTAVACEPSDRLVTKPTAPLNIDLDAFGGLVSLDSTTTTFQLEYAARAQLDFAMAIKFAFPPEFKILDTSKIEAKLGVAADNVNLTATIAGLELDLGAAVVIKADGGDHEGADSADTLTDTDATFVTTYPPAAGATFVQAGNVLTNTTKSKKCIVKTIAATALTCADPLPDSAVFADTDTYKITGAGVAKLGAELMVNQPGTDSGDEDNDGFTIGDFFTGLSADLQGTTQDCGGKIDPYPTGGGDEVDLMGHACARLSVSSDLTDYIGDVTFLAPDFATPAGWKFGAPDLEAVLGSFELDWALILKAMPKLLENLANSLNGAASDRSIPLVGDALDAGADVVLKIKENVADPLADLATQIDTAGDVEPSGGGDGDTDPLDLEKAAQDFIFGVFGPGGSAGIDLLQDTDGSGGAPDAADVVITVLCDHSGTVEPCVNGDDLFIIDDFRLTALIGEGSPSGQGCSPCELGTSIPISLGLPGFPLSIDGTIQANVGWRVLIDFGLSRADGPYLATGAHDVAGTLTAGEKELLLGASLSLGDNAPACALDPNPNTGVVDELKEFDSDRCVKGTLGFLAVTIRDGNDGTDPEKEPTSVAVEASLDLGSDGADPDRLTFPELLSGKANLDFNFGVTANVDVRIRTGLNLSSEHAPDFPSVLGRFHLEWSWALGTGSSDPDLSFDGLYIDAGRFLTDLLGPTAEEIKRVLSPFKPFIDFIQTPLPVISDISQLAGGPPITLIDVIEAASGQDLSMVRSVLEVVQFVQNLPTASNGLLIPLSSSITDGFSIAGDKAKGSPVTPDKAGTLVTPSGTPSTGLLAAIGGATGSSPSASTTPDGRPKTFGVSG